jgi:hypothetical protein
MRKIFELILIAMMTIFLSSCVTSLQPITTYDRAITDNRVVGNWAHENDGFKIEPFFQSELEKQMKKLNPGQRALLPSLTGNSKTDSIFHSKMYIVSFERNKATYYMAAALMKIGNNLFMDLFPLLMNDTKVKEDLANPYSLNYDYQAGFTMAKVELNNNQQLTLKFIDGSFVKTQVLAGKMRLRHEKDALFDTFIITASTNELRSFIEKYADDARVFSKDATIVLTRKPGHL